MLDISSVGQTHLFESWELCDGALQLRGGSYGSADAMRAESERVRFRHGLGLPGKVWGSRRPLLCEQFPAVDFVRADAARSAGVVAALGLPVLRRGDVTSVFTLLTVNRPPDFACEIWRPAGGGRLAMRSGYYGSRRMQAAGADGRLPHGQGFPGIVWDTAAPLLVEDLDTSPLPLRSASQDAAARAGLGIPVDSGGKLEVVLLIFGSECPLARVIEIWRPEGNRLRLSQSAGGEILGDFGRRGTTIQLGEGQVGEAARSRMPLVSERAVEADRWRRTAMDFVGLHVSASYPVVVADRLKAVITLLN